MKSGVSRCNVAKVSCKNSSIWLNLFVITLQWHNGIFKMCSNQLCMKNMPLLYSIHSKIHFFFFTYTFIQQNTHDRTIHKQYIRLLVLYRSDISYLCVSVVCIIHTTVPTVIMCLKWNMQICFEFCCIWQFTHNKSIAQALYFFLHCKFVSRSSVLCKICASWVFYTLFKAKYTVDHWQVSKIPYLTFKGRKWPMRVIYWSTGAYNLRKVLLDIWDSK